MVSFKLIGSGVPNSSAWSLSPAVLKVGKDLFFSVDIPGRIESSDLKSVFEVSVTALWRYVEKGQSRGNLYS